MADYSQTQSFGQYSPYDVMSGNVNNGVDYSTPSGTPIYLPEGNWVVQEVFNTARGQGFIGDNTNQGYGNSVVVRNKDTGETIRFSHLSSAEVKPGASLKGGLVGYTGATGNVTGPHLDVEYTDQYGKLSDISRTPYAQSIFNEQKPDSEYRKPQLAQQPKSVMDTLLDYIVPQADAAELDPTNPGGLKTYSHSPFQPNANGAINYMVKPGDTLWDIAEQYLGGGQNYGQIKGYGGSPNQLPVGQQLQIPQKTLSFTAPTPRPQQNSSPAAANYSSPSGPAVAPAAKQSYSVKPSQPTSQPSAQLNFSPSKPVTVNNGKSPNNLTTKSGLKLTI